MLINVIGAERTGSTLLDVLLGHGNQAFSCGEISFRFRPMRTHDFIFDCSCGNDDCPVWTKLDEVNEKQIHNRLLSEFPYVIDSSKHLVWVIDNIQSLDPQHKYLNIATWKSPKKILFSHWKRGHDLKKAFKEYLNYYDDLLQCGIPFVTISHEALTNETVRFLKHFESLTGLTYFEGKERFWEENNHHFLFGSNGIRKQMKKSESVMYQEKLDVKFDAVYEQFMSQISESSKDAQILNEMDKRSIFNFTELPESKSTIKRPYWYYIKKYGRMVKKYLPSKYEIKNVSPTTDSN